jgi:hypothetical protein
MSERLFYCTKYGHVGEKKVKVTAAIAFTLLMILGLLMGFLFWPLALIGIGGLFLVLYKITVGQCVICRSSRHLIPADSPIAKACIAARREE